MSCCFSFQFQYTDAPLFIFAASSPFQSGRTLGNNNLPQGFSIQENKARNMMQCSVRMLPLGHSEGETKGHTAPVFPEKEPSKHFLEEFTTFLWLTDWFTPKNVLWAEILHWQSAVYHSRLPPQASCYYVLPTCQISSSPSFKCLCLLWYQLTKKNRLLIARHSMHVIKQLVEL